jgi:hypothetical protein
MKNCNHPNYPAMDCKAIHFSKQECDCRWCVFHKEFNKARGKESEVLAQIINP